MAEKNTKRKPDIMFLNIIFCLLVMYIHIASEVVLEMPMDTTFFKVVFVTQRLSCFVVPGFIMLSGVKLFLNNKDKINYLKYYASRFYRIFVPYAIWVAVYYLWLSFKGAYDFSLWGLLNGILTGNVWAHFYFVVILMQFIILTPLWMFLYKRGCGEVHIAFSLIITILSSMYLMSVLGRVFPDMPNIDLSNCFLSYMVYWAAGCLIGNNYDGFKRYLKSNKIMITLTFLLCGAMEGGLSILTYRAEPVWTELFKIMYNMSAIIFFYMIAQVFYSKVKVLLKPMAVIDRSSYMIYLTHCLVIVIVNDEMTRRGILDLSTRFGIRAAAVYVITFTVCILWRLLRLCLKGKRKKGE